VKLAAKGNVDDCVSVQSMGARTWVLDTNVSNSCSSGVTRMQNVTDDSRSVNDRPSVFSSGSVNTNCRTSQLPVYRIFFQFCLSNRSSSIDMVIVVVITR